MFGSIGGPELLLIFVLALLLFGPRKLPEIGKTIGKTLAEFKRATSEFSTSLEREIELEKLKDLRADLKDPAQGVIAAVSRERGGAAEKSAEPPILPDGG